jgi:predicted porin
VLKNTRLKALALAVIGTCGLPLAAHAEPNVTIYGKLYPEITRVELTGATASGTTLNTLIGKAPGAADVHQVNEDSPNSRLGFRGTENLGGNLKAFFQLEIGLETDTGNNSSTGSLFSRDTFIGLAGDFGTVRLGSMDTVYKNLGDTLSFLGISSGNFISTSNILSKPGIGSSSASSFHLRRPNSVVYESPEFGGFQVLFDYSLGELPDDFKRNTVISTGAKYENGPFYAAIAYELHNDMFGGSKNVTSALRNDSNVLAHSKDEAVRLTGQYAFTKSTRAEVNLVKVRYNETGGAAGKFQEYRHNAWSVALEHKISAWTLVGSYGGATARC